jgi:hypothetical protein
VSERARMALPRSLLPHLHRKQINYAITAILGHVITPVADSSFGSLTRSFELFFLPTSIPRDQVRFLRLAPLDTALSRLRAGHVTPPIDGKVSVTRLSFVRPNNGAEN